MYLVNKPGPFEWYTYLAPYGTVTYSVAPPNGFVKLPR